jgi:hypothetical protein
VAQNTNINLSNTQRKTISNIRTEIQTGKVSGERNRRMLGALGVLAALYTAKQTGTPIQQHIKSNTMSKNLAAVQTQVPQFKEAAANSKLNPLELGVFGIKIPTKINGVPGQVYVKNNKFYGKDPYSGKMTRLAYASGVQSVSNARFQTIPGNVPNWAQALPSK